MIASWERPEGVSLRLLLIRHGEPHASARGRCYGKLDISLSSIGREQMTRVAEVLASMSLDAIYASPRRRALESAQQLTRQPVVDARLAEIDFGELEGLTYDEAAERFPEIYDAWMRTPTEVHFPGGESFEEMRRRVLEMIAEIRAAHYEHTVAIVAHGGVNRIALAEALGLDAAKIFRMEQTHAGVSVIDELDGEHIVRVMNARC